MSSGMSFAAIGISLGSQFQEKFSEYSHSDQGGQLMRTRYAPKANPTIINRKERKCLRCGKKIVGKWLCPSCVKYNATAGDLLDRYELHGLSIMEGRSFSEV
jgi:hypothetical protein